MPRQTQKPPGQGLLKGLNVQDLMEIAAAKSGLSEFGGLGFVEPLNKLIECAPLRMKFHAQGAENFKNDLVRCLINRLRMHKDIQEHPEILAEDVSDPIIIIGLGRSGTTKLHKMLSAPATVQRTDFWRVWNPARFPDAEPGKPDPRIAVAGTSQHMTENNPALDVAHRMAAQEVEEEWMLYLITFNDWIWNQYLFMPEYFDWVMARPSLDTFRQVRTMLQYLQWQDGGRRGRPWILKTVGYLANMDALLECYPNATLVHTHRDPRATIPSMAKFLGAGWQLYAEPLDRHAIGDEMLRQWSTVMERYLEARQRLKLDGRILDVEYEQVRSDPMSILREVYRRAGRRLDSPAEQQMQAWHDGNEQYSRGRHEYTLAEFRLSEARVDQAFADYIRRFIRR